MNETFTNADEASELFGRLKPGVRLKLGEREYMILGDIEEHGASVAETVKAQRIGSAQEVNITFESVFATLNAGREVKIVEANDNEPKAPERNSGRSVEEED